MKRNLLTFSTVAGFALALSACSGAEEATEKKTVTRVDVGESQFKPVELENTIDNLIGEIGKTAPQDLQLGVVLKALSGYWEPVKVGSNRAFGELEVAGVVLAPAEGTPDEATLRQVELLDQRKNEGYDGFGVAPLNEVVAPELDELVDTGIPVVTIDSDMPTSKRQLYIGTINYEAGRTSGETLAGMLSGGAGTVIILGNTDAGWVDGFNRTQGAIDVLTEAGYTTVVRNTSWTDEGAVEDVTFMTDALETADPPAVGMLSMFSPTFRLAQAAEAAELTADDVTIVGFDFEPETLSYMRSGMIKATHAQRQYYMGYMVPYVLYSMKVLGVEKTMDIISPHMVDESRFNAGIDVVHADEVEDYNSFLDSLGIGG
ncbi:MAG TPA: substrate-binding domain-containing protein [Polyangiaceae bacterium]